MGALLRSFLFVPAADDRLFDSACAKGSDAVILDLEDGTHASRKAAARQGLPARYQRLSTAGKAVAVRVNGDLLTLAQDLRAAVRPGLDLLVLPKVEHARDVQLVATAIGALEAERGLAPGHVRLLLQIESAVALPRLHDIAAAHPRVMGMMLGSEDFSLDLGDRLRRVDRGAG
jgi:citrate lyase subunit beta / citryl-CoA lyase